MAAEYADPKTSSLSLGIPRPVSFLRYSSRDFVELFVTKMVLFPYGKLG